MRTAMACVCLVACAPLQRHAPQIAASLASAALISATACDWRQTREAARDDWYPPAWGYQALDGSERNPVLGPRPSMARVDGWFAFALTAEVAGSAAALAVPRWRWIGAGILTALTLLELESVRGNAAIGLHCL